jgi:hypothetical protein
MKKADETKNIFLKTIDLNKKIIYNINITFDSYLL